MSQTFGFVSALESSQFGLIEQEKGEFNILKCVRTQLIGDQFRATTLSTQNECVDSECRKSVVVGDCSIVAGN